MRRGALGGGGPGRRAPSSNLPAPRPYVPGPHRRRRLPDLTDRVVVDPAQHVHQVDPGVDLVKAATAGQREQAGGRPGAALGPREEPIRWFDDRSSKLELAAVIVDRDLWVRQAGRQGLLMVQGVPERLGDGRGRSQAVNQGDPPGLHLVEDRSGLGVSGASSVLEVVAPYAAVDVEEDTDAGDGLVDWRRLPVARLDESTAGVAPAAGAD